MSTRGFRLTLGILIGVVFWIAVAHARYCTGPDDHGCNPPPTADLYDDWAAKSRQRAEMERAREAQDRQMQNRFLGQERGLMGQWQWRDK